MHLCTVFFNVFNRGLFAEFLKQLRQHNQFYYFYTSCAGLKQYRPMIKHSQQLNLESKPKVIVDLPPLLEAYCRYVFETPPNQETIVVNRHNLIGKALYGFLEKSTVKPGVLNFVNPVVFSIPITEKNQYSVRSHYWYINADENEAFTDRVETLYSGWVETFFRDGYAMNLDQVSIIECVLDILNVRLNVANFDMIKKYDYRLRRSRIREKSKHLLKLRFSDKYKIYQEQT